MPPDQTAIAKTRLDGLPPQAIRYVLATANALELGRPDEAERHIIGVMALHPDHPEVLRLLAGIQNLRGDKRGAIASMRRAVAQRPDDALYHNTLGAVLGENTELDAAVMSLRRACELQPDLASAWYNLGVLLMRSIRPDESAQALRRAVELEPEHARARVMLGEMLRASGHYDEAAAQYRRVLEKAPHAGTAWWGLADLKNRKLDEVDIERIRAAMQRPDTGEDDLIAMGFALAKALEDQGRYADSLAALGQAHARARRRQQWDARGFSGRIDYILRAFPSNNAVARRATPTPPPPLAGEGKGVGPAPNNAVARSATPTPPPLLAGEGKGSGQAATEPLGHEVIFIVSMPRSGSSLAEQILASHSQVDGAGELPDLPQIISEESRRRGQQFPLWVGQATPADWQRMGLRYLERTTYWRRRRPRFTDKLPNNWEYVGAIRAMLPAARIVVCRRDPLETCLACYRQMFARHDYTRTFADLAAYWRDFDRSVRHWRALHPQHLHEMVYEELVVAPEAQIRALLEFCGLPFEPGCVDFHKTERDVYTPSAAQVREPLRRDTARAPRYGALLDPLRSALGLPPQLPTA